MEGEAAGQQETTGDIGAWSDAWRPGPELAVAFEGMVEQLRGVQDLVSGARPTVEAADRAAGLLEAVAVLMAPFQVGESDQLAGKQHHLSGRAQSLVPVVEYEQNTPDEVTAWVTFTRFYLGGGGAAHGGALPLVFDELLGRLAGQGGRPRSRTAYLHVNYRRVTPLDRRVLLSGWVASFEGRKIMTRGTITDRGEVLADAEGLFVTLLPGQP